MDKHGVLNTLYMFNYLHTRIFLLGIYDGVALNAWVPRDHHICFELVRTACVVTYFGAQKG